MAESIKVEGLSKLSRELKKLKAELPKELRQASKDAAEIVAEESRRRAPRRTGRLAGQVKSAATNRGGQVRLDRLVYAKPIHFGWPKHNIKPNPFMYDALDDRRDEVVEKFEKSVHDIVERSITPGLE